jgi:hypothetical protein
LIRKYWPLTGLLGLFWIVALGMAALVVRMSQGRLVYVLDDAYIHLAMAKNFTLHGVWGVTAEAFTSTTSSPLWTLLLAGCFRVFGMHDSYPLWLNLIFGSALLVVSYRFLDRQVQSGWLKFTILTILLFITPLATLALTGMEHVLHLLLSLLFLWLAADRLADEKPASLHRRFWLGGLALLMTATRYEGLFMVFVVCVLFLTCKRFVEAVILGIAGLLPVLGYGLVSLRQGWYFLPNSILLKGRLPDFSLEGVARLLGYTALEQLINHGVLLVLCTVVLASCVYALIRRQGKPDFKIYTALIYLGSLMLHLQFAQTGWFYRYEAYLVYLGGLVTGLFIEDLLVEIKRVQMPIKASLGYVPVVLLALVVAFPFADRAARAFLTTSQAMNNIYEQQYQMGKFIRDYYAGEAIAINDIGAVSYLAEPHLLDLWGLANLDVTRAKMERVYSPEKIAELVDRDGVKIAIVYDMFFEETGGLPASWEKVGEWRIPDNRVCASDTVVFYAVDASAKAGLMRNLHDFQSQLPEDVKQSGEYLGSKGGS